MAKCLPLQEMDESASGRPGLIAVPHRNRNAGYDQPTVFDVQTLRRIEDLLNAHSSGTASWQAANPAFERIQVRCQLVVDRFRDDGAMAQQLKDELSRILSVWTAPPMLQRFGWTLNMNTLRAHICGLDYVRAASGFSLLQFARNDGASHVLLDTAQDDERGSYGPVLRPGWPWSLPLPTRDHVLSIVSEADEEEAVQSGIGRLGIGDMLIVGQRVAS